MKKSFVIAAASAFVAAGAFVAVANAQTPYSPSFGQTGLACKGANACKGQSACKGGNHSCKGLNACKGQGFSEMTKGDCAAAKGKFKAG
jgi:hypothetical protein